MRFYRLVRVETEPARTPRSNSLYFGERICFRMCFQICYELCRYGFIQDLAVRVVRVRNRREVEIRIDEGPRWQAKATALRIGKKAFNSAKTLTLIHIVSHR